jgi:hypothetical protein
MDYLYLGIPSVLSSLYAQEVVGSLRGTRILLGTWCLMSTMEWINNFDMFRTDGLLSWRVLSLRPGLIFRSSWAELLFGERSIAWVLAIRTAAAICLIAMPFLIVECVALFVLVATSRFLKVRSLFGEDGADQMGQIVSIGALLTATGIALNALVLSFAGTLLIAGQLILSYFVAGFSKLLSSEWRLGQAIVAVMGTHSYGHDFAARVVGGNVLTRVSFCWLVILAETLFPLAIFAPHSALLLALAGFFMFHVANAYFMGLNTFLWAFAAAYPSVILLNDLTIRALGSK